MAIDYVLRQTTRDGRAWRSDEVFTAAAPHVVKQAVVAGYLNGEARWAETPDGQFIYGIDAKGTELRGAP